MESNPELSRSLSLTLDCLGYSRDMVKYRVQMYREIAENENMGIIAGSKGEGLAAPYESDTDRMITNINWACGNDTQQLSRRLPKCLVLKTDRQSTPPGYTYLTLTHIFGGYLASVNDNYPYILSENGEMYASSDLFMEDFRQLFQEKNNNKECEMAEIGLHFTMEDRSGPSLPVTDNLGASDLVISFFCICPDLLQSWVARPRYYTWPTPDTIQQISRLEAHVVPVGFKGSEHQYKEWRICFTKAELCLMHSMNDTQTKLYILLKMVAKTIIQPVCKDITSYIMKNIVLWMAELNPHELFRQELLIDRLIQSLHFLRLCVTNNFLPNYMIPSRNLLAGRLDLQHREQLSTLLTYLIRDGWVLIILPQHWLKLKSGLHMMYTLPDNLLRFGEWRDRVEKVTLLSEHLWPYMRDNGLDEQHLSLLYNIRTYKSFLLAPDIIELHHSGMNNIDVCYISMERQKTALS